ncbi:MAG: aminopeptidase [Clostridia bacterium]|nr:aminopeptidase [Clostridia bacterium]
MSEKTKSEQLKEKLFKNTKNGYCNTDKADVEKAYSFSEGYVDFINYAKTERLFCEKSIKVAVENGFTEYVPGKKYNSGDKVYVNQRNKAVILCVFGKKSLKEGVRIAAAHIDSPRIDLKANPVYQAEDMCYFKTHYYGGIRKYQWTAIPLCLYGVVMLADGTKVEVAVGRDEKDPKFVITDLLPHLAQEQSKRPLSEGIKGEELNILIGSRPFEDNDEAESVKLNILNILFEKYGIVEADFQSAELELVPAFDACDIGFDRSLVGGYGHDDRVCAYPALMAALTATEPDYTSISVLTDKEETGSDGNTGLRSAYLKNFVYDIATTEGLNGYEVLRHSMCLSADVNAGYDPTFPDVFERNNCAFINKGVVITKYTGARGKGDTSDASAEYVGFIRKMLVDNNIVWQTGELGKVDCGGGGTVAKYIANMDVDTVDLGVPVLSMHSPFEVISKLDLYMAYKAFCAFFK